MWCSLQSGLRYSEQTRSAFLSLHDNVANKATALPVSFDEDLLMNTGNLEDEEEGMRHVYKCPRFTSDAESDQRPGI